MVFLITYSSICGKKNTNSIREVEVTIGFNSYEDAFDMDYPKLVKIYEKCLKRLFGTIYIRMSRVFLRRSKYDYYNKTMADIYY
jgi:hypothetical protein